MPATIRGTSTTEDGRAHLQWLMMAVGLWGTTLGAALWALAQNESSHQQGRPANTYNMLDRSDRRGASLITAWGMFQYNRDAWRGLSEEKSYLGDRAAAQGTGEELPQDASEFAELWFPIRRYWLLYDTLVKGGRRDPLGTVISVRALHSGSGRLRSWLRVYRPGVSAVRAAREWAAQDSESGRWAASHIPRIIRQTNEAFGLMR